MGCWFVYCIILPADDIEIPFGKSQRNTNSRMANITATPLPDDLSSCVSAVVHASAMNRKHKLPEEEKDIKLTIRIEPPTRKSLLSVGLGEGTFLGVSADFIWLLLAIESHLTRFQENSVRRQCERIYPENGIAEITAFRVSMNVLPKLLLL